MKTIQRIALAGATIAGMGLALLNPTGAAAAQKANPQGGASVAHVSRCATGRVASIAKNLPIRTEPLHSAALITTAQPGDQYDCLLDFYTLGDRYTACGHSNANGWLVIVFNDGLLGFTYMTCMTDV